MKMLSQKDVFKDILSCSNSSRAKFAAEYKRIQRIQNTEELYLFILCELVKSVSKDSFKNFKKFSKFIENINSLESVSLLENYFKNNGNPLRNTNLVILSCKFNRTKFLKFVLSECKILQNLSTEIGESAIAPNDVDEMSHNAFYYAIRSGKIELLEILISKWPGKYFDIYLKELENIISREYKELKLKHVPLSKEIEIWVQNKLLNMCVLSNAPEEPQNVDHLNAIKVRLQMVLDKIKLLVAEYHLNSKDIDEKFLYIAKIVAQNIHILKQQLKCTYEMLPWEEIEFCLYVFVSSHIKQDEMNLFNHALLKKDKVLYHLENFARKLAGRKILECIDTSKPTKLPKFQREFGVREIIKNNPEFRELYNDYKNIRDIHSLDKISDYINLALSTDPKEREGQIIIIRVLQVIGEHLKNSWESPKLSVATGELLLISLPKNTREVITALRNSLSHASALSKRIEIEKNVDIHFFIGMQTDLKHIGDVIFDILFNNKIKIIRMVLENIINCADFKEIRDTAATMKHVNIDNIMAACCKVKERNRTASLIQKLKNIISHKTDYEQGLFDKIDKLINYEVENNGKDYFLGLVTLKALRFSLESFKNDINIFRGIKFRANEDLKNFIPEIQENSLKQIVNLSVKIFNSYSLRFQHEEVIKIIYELCYNAEFETNDIQWIEELREKLNNKRHSTPSYKLQICHLKEEKDIILKMRVSELESILNKHAVSQELVENISSYMNNKNLQIITEMLVLDILSILDMPAEFQKNYILFLDDDVPLLTGKCLRNHLAHYNTIVDLMLKDPSIYIFLNAKMLNSENIENGNILHYLTKYNFSRLKYEYDKDVRTVLNQNNMFTALEEGNIESFKNCLENGADINGITIDGWTSLHFASKGTSLDIVKFILNENSNISCSIKNINGYSPLHIASLYGRKDIVAFYVKERGMSIDAVDDKLKTPLHLAAQNGHKDTVIVLLENKAKTTAKDLGCNSPLAYALRNDHYDVVKFLLENERYGNIDDFVGPFTCLYLAAEAGSLKIVNFLLENQANVNAKGDRRVIPLHVASLNGHLDVVNALLLKGSEVNARCIDGCTPLHYAAENGHEMIAKVLVKHGANVNAFGKIYHFTPLHFASKDGCKGIADILLKNKANVNSSTVAGMTPLHFASQGGHAEIVTTLLKYDIDINAKDINFFTPLHFAAENGHKKIVKLLSKNNVSINVKDCLGFTPVHKAALKNHTEIIELLFKYGAEINAKSMDGLTPLHLASMANHISAIEYLVKSKAELNAKNNDGLFPLHVAALNGHSQVINFLLKNNVDCNAIDAMNMTSLHTAALSGHKDVLDILIKHKAEVNVKSLSGTTPLHCAVIANNEECVKKLVENGANIKVKDKTGNSPLLYAVKNNNKFIVQILISMFVDLDAEEKAFSVAVIAGYKNIVEIFLKNKAPVTKKSDENLTLLHLAAKNGNKEIAELLIQNGADVDAAAINNVTPIYIAAEEGHENFVEILIAYNASINIKSNEGVTPLNIAATFGHTKVVKVLIDSGANTNLKDNKNRTAIELAVARGHLEVVKLLVQCNVDVNAKGNDDWSLLHIAAQENNLEIIKYLVSVGCNMNAKNSSGSKPLHIAAREGFGDTLEYFLDKGFGINDLGVAKQTMLHYAASKGKLEIVRFLIMKGADVNVKDRHGITPLHMAVKFSFKNVAEILIKNGAHYNAVDKYHRTPSIMSSDETFVKFFKATNKLFEVVRHNIPSEIESCINDGAIVNTKNSKSETPLHYAAWKNYIEVVNILLNNKCDANSIESKGFTPLHYAAKFSHLEVVKVLLRNGAMYDVFSTGGKTPLDLAEDKDIITLLEFVTKAFMRVKNNDSKIIADLNKMKDIGTVKAVLSARNRENRTLVVSALLNKFSGVEQLKEILQEGVSIMIHKALNLFGQGNYQNALTIFNRVLEERKEILGPDNPGTLDIQAYIARVIYKTGAFQDALNLHEEIFQKQKEMLGINNKDTLKTRSGIALILHKLGKNEESLDVHRDVYFEQLKTLGSDHEDTLQTQLHMALALGDLGKYDEALLNNKEIYEKQKKSNNPYAVFAQNNIAMVLSKQGKYDEALKEYKDVLIQKKIMLGGKHPDTLRTLQSIGSILQMQKKHSDALKVFKEVLCVQKKVLSPIHPESLNTQHNIANSLFAQDRCVAAFKIYTEILELRKSVWGPNDPTVLDILMKIEIIKSKFRFQGIMESDIPKCIQTDIIIASNDGDVDAVKLLLKDGDDVNETDSEGRTPLHFAVNNNHTRLVKILLKQGANPTQITNKGNTSLHTATVKGHDEIVKILLEHTSIKKLNHYINAVTNVGRNTALHVAAKNGSLNVVTCLLEHGAIYNLKNKEGKLPLDVSSDQNVRNLLKSIEGLFQDAKNGNIRIISKLEAMKHERMLAVTSSRSNQEYTLLQVLINNKHKHIAVQLSNIIKAL